MTESPGESGELWTELRGAVGDAAADALRRVGRRTPGWWRSTTRLARTRADAVHDLVGTVARLTRDVEGGDDHGVPEMPPRADVLADQLAVVTYDLLTALDATRDERVARAATGAYETTANEVDPR